MAILLELDGKAPAIGREVFLAPTAVLVGDVRVGDRANIWFGAVLRGDTSYIEPGGVFGQDTVIHSAEELATVIGAWAWSARCAPGGLRHRRARVSGWSGRAPERARRSGAMVAAGAVVRERATVAPEVLAAGNPAVEKKKLSGSALRWTRTASDEYQRFSKRYTRASRVPTDTRVA